MMDGLVTQLFPNCFVEFAAYDLDNLARAACALGERLGKRCALAEGIKETSGKEVAGSGGVDNMVNENGGNGYTLGAALSHCATGADLDDGNLADGGEGSEGSLGVKARHCSAFFLVGEHNVGLRKQMLKESVVFFNNII